MPPEEKKKKTRSKPASTLSFDLEDEGDSFEVKKSKPRGHKHARTKPHADEATPAVDTVAGPSGGTYTAEHLHQLRASMKFTSVPAAPPADDPQEVRRAALCLVAARVDPLLAPHPFPRPGQRRAIASRAQGVVPNAEDIRKARAERERARRLAEEAGGRGLAGPEGAEFIPLEGSAPSESRDPKMGRYVESRFVREDQERDDEDDTAFDDQVGATLSFGQPASRARTPRPEVSTVQDIDDDDGSSGTSARRPAPVLSYSAPRDRASSSQSLAEHAAFLADASRAALLPERLDDAARRLGHQLSALQHEHKETARLLQVRAHANCVRALGGAHPLAPQP